MRTRLAVLAAAVAVSAFAAPGGAAAPRPQVVDPAGDAVGGQGGMDITSAVWSTTGTTSVTKVRGRKVTTYTPTKLVVTTNLAAAPTANPPMSYEMSAEVDGCGEVRFTWTPGTVFSELIGDSSLWVDCGEADPTTGDTLLLIPNVDMKIGAKSVTWTISLKMLPKNVRAGSRWSDFRAAVDVIDPVFGLYGTRDLGQSVDAGTGAGTWVLK